MPFAERFWSNAYVLLPLTALFWAGNALASRMAVGEVSPMLLTLLRWAGVCLVLFPFYAREVASAMPVLMRHPWRAIGMAAFGFTGFNLLMYTAGQYTTALNIGLLQGAMPAMIFLLAFFAHRTTVRPLQIVGVAITMIGVAVIATGGSLEALLALRMNRGDLLMLAACAFYGAYTVLVRDRPAMPGIVFFVAMALIACAAAIPPALYEYWRGDAIWPTTKGWLIALYVTFFPSLLAQIFYIRSIELVGPGRSGVFTNLTPAFTALLAVALLREPFGWAQGAALALILSGIALAERGPSSMKTSLPLEPDAAPKR